MEHPPRQEGRAEETEAETGAVEAVEAGVTADEVDLGAMGAKERAAAAQEEVAAQEEAAAAEGAKEGMEERKVAAAGCGRRRSLHARARTAGAARSPGGRAAAA